VSVSFGGLILRRPFILAFCLVIMQNLSANELHRRSMVTKSKRRCRSAHLLVADREGASGRIATRAYPACAGEVTMKCRTSAYDISEISSVFPSRFEGSSQYASRYAAA